MKKLSIPIETRWIGVVLLAICITFLFVLVSLLNEMQRSGVLECPCVGGTCPMERSLPITYVGFTAVLILAIISFFMLIPKRAKKIEKVKEWEEVLNGLKGDEKKVYQVILDSGGAIPQSELVEKTNFSKVKVSRTLDKLEVKGLIEKRRRGMGNIVVLK
jgi:uncharacterized membrane protein